MTEAFLIESLRSRGLKVTPQRHLICRLIASADGHPSAEMLYDEAVRVMPTLSLKTVYTTLSELAQMGAIRLARFGTENMRVDTEMTPHAHALCNDCGRLTDLPIQKDALHALWSAADGRSFEIEGCEVVYRGRCSDCAKTDRLNTNDQVEKGGE